MPPLVSVIVPTYNRLPVLGRALASIAAQTYADRELIIIDDGSTDGTVEWLQQQSCDRLIALPENKGGAAARNAGIKQARGEYIAFLDSDDEWQPDYLQLMVTTLEANPDAPMVYSGYTCKIKGKQVWQGTTKPEYINQMTSMLLRNFIHGMTVVVIPRKTLQQVGGLDEDLRFQHDLALFLRILHLCGDAVPLLHTAVIRHITPLSLTTTKQWEINAQSAIVAIDKFFHLPGAEIYKSLHETARRLQYRAALDRYRRYCKWFNY